MMPSTGEPAYAMMCGGFGKDCDGVKFLNFTGYSPYTPFEIAFTFFENGKNSDRVWSPNIDSDIHYCNETFKIGSQNNNEQVEISACSCTDCAGSCPPLDPVPDPIPPFLIFGIDGIQLILAVVYIIFCWLIITVAIAYHFYIQQRKHQIDSENRWIS